MDIDALKNQIETEISHVASLEDLEALRIKYMGRKGALAQLTATIPTMPVQERAVVGQKVNALKQAIQVLLTEKEKQIAGKTQAISKDRVDIGMPGIAQELGRLHPLTQVTNEICAIFKQMGFIVVEGPEIETEENNFTGLNIPLEHPSREAFDTFYLAPSAHVAGQGRETGDRRLLRSHTSPVQIRVMKARKPPLAVVVPGKVYRPDATDASHSYMFHQIEGFLVDKQITFADLKGVLDVFAKAIFGNDVQTRFRPHFFPFTEPSAEVDVSCMMCKGKGCSACGRKGWLEILGSGMIHPHVFKHVGYPAHTYTGFAFGMGVDRIAMLKYGIHDIRLLYQNDLRFLRQF